MAGTHQRIRGRTRLSCGRRTSDGHLVCFASSQWVAHVRHSCAPCPAHPSCREGYSDGWAVVGCCTVIRHIAMALSPFRSGPCVTMVVPPLLCLVHRAATTQNTLCGRACIPNRLLILWRLRGVAWIQSSISPRAPRELPRAPRERTP